MAFQFAGRYGPEIFLDAQQNLMRGKQVTVYNKGTLVLADLFTDRTKAYAAPNPFTTDSFGNGTFFADPGEYDMVYGGQGHVVLVPMDSVEAAGDGPPTGPAGGVLSGFYPNPGFAVDMATQAELDLKANAANAALTGIPTAPTAAPATNTTQVATTAFVTGAVNDLVAAAPGTLNTLDELAAALGDDPNLATTLTNNIATKLAIAGHTNQSLPVSIAGSLADLVMGPSTILARLAAGDIIAATPAQIRTLLGILSTAEIRFGPFLIGAGTGSVTINHNLGSTNIESVSVRKISTGEIWSMKTVVVDANNVSLDFGTYVRAANEFDVIITRVA